MAQNLFYRSPLPTKSKPGPTVLTIKPHRPWLCPVLIVLIVGIVVWGGMLLCQHSTQSLDYSLRTLLEERSQALKLSEQDNLSLQAQNQELQEKINTIIKAAQADQETYAKVLQTLSQLQEDKHDLVEELDFYKKLLISTTPATEKLVVRGFTFTHQGETELYPYKLVLSGASKEPVLYEGNVQLEIRGKTNGKKNSLSMKEVTPDARESLLYRVIYFQRLQGTLKLPKDFVPENVVVRLFPQGQEKAEETTVEWKN
jgi:hypothetical protein